PAHRREPRGEAPRGHRGAAPPRGPQPPGRPRRPRRLPRGAPAQDRSPIRKQRRGEWMKFRGGMGELMRQASRMQRKVEQRREELKEQTFESSAGNDRVKVVVTGAGELAGVTIDPALLADEGIEMTQDLIVAAANAALTLSRETVDA